MSEKTKEAIKSIPVRTITMPSLIPPAVSEHQSQLVDSPSTSSIPVVVPPPSCDMEAFHPPAEANEIDPTNPFFRKRKVRRNPAVLSRWIQDHHPSSYPTKMEKEILCRKAGMTIRQLNDFFANARRNIKKKGFEAWKKKHPSYSAFLSPDIPLQLPTMEQQQHHFHLSQTPSNTLPVRHPSPIPSFPPIGPPPPTGTLFTPTNNNLNMPGTLPTVLGLATPPTSLSGGDNSPSVIFPNYYSSYFKPLPCSFSGCIGGAPGGGRADSTFYNSPPVSSSALQQFCHHPKPNIIFPSYPSATGRIMHFPTAPPPPPPQATPLSAPAAPPSHPYPYFSQHHYKLDPLSPSQLSQLSTGSSPYSDNLSPLLKIEQPDIPPPDSPPDMSPPISPPALTIATTAPTQTATPQPLNVQLPAWSHFDSAQPEHTCSIASNTNSATPLNLNGHSRVFRSFYQPLAISPNIVASSFHPDISSSSWLPAAGGSGSLWETPRFCSNENGGGRGNLRKIKGEEGSEQVSSQDGVNLEVTEDAEVDFCDSTKE